MTGNPIGWVVNGVLYTNRVVADRAYRKKPGDITPVFEIDKQKYNEYGQPVNDPTLHELYGIWKD